MINPTKFINTSLVLPAHQFVEYSTRGVEPSDCGVTSFCRSRPVKYAAIDSIPSHAIPTVMRNTKQSGKKNPNTAYSTTCEMGHHEQQFSNHGIENTLVLSMSDEITFFVNVVRMIKYSTITTASPIIQLTDRLHNG